MVGVARFLKIRQVAAHACSGSPRVFSSRVACRTVQGRVHSGKSKAGKLQVVEFRALPVVDGVALLALRENPAATWLGEVVCWKVLWWQE